MTGNARLRRGLLEVRECSVHGIIRQFMPRCLQNVGVEPVVSVLGSDGIEAVKGSRGRGRDLTARRFNHNNGSGLAIPVPERFQSSKT